MVKFRKSPNWRNIVLNFGEGALVIVTGLVLEFSDDYFTAENKHIGYVVGLIGAFIFFNRLINSNIFKEAINTGFEKSIEREEGNSASILEKVNLVNQKIYEISRIIDLQSSIQINILKNLAEAYLSITEPEFAKVKDVIIADTFNILTNLKNNKRSEKLTTSEYYEWLLPIINGCVKGDKIKAVSCMFNSEWDDSPAEQQFIESNINAAKIGTTVERLFLFDPKLYNEIIQIPAIVFHTKEEQETYGLNGYYINKDKLEMHEPISLMDTVGHGFIIINSRVALIDTFDSEGKVRGVVTMNQSDIKNLESTYNRLKHYSRPLLKNIRFKSE